MRNRISSPGAAVLILALVWRVAAAGRIGEIGRQDDTAGAQRKLQNMNASGIDIEEHGSGWKTCRKYNETDLLPHKKVRVVLF